MSSDVSPKEPSGGVGLPVGIVTFVLTDIEGSTRLWETQGTETGLVVQRHHEILTELIEKFGGARPRDQGEGDSLLAVFAKPSDAAVCALSMQEAMRAELWPDGVSIKIRIGVHTGESARRDEHNYMGLAVARAGRIRDLAQGGQTLVSETTAGLIRDSIPQGAALKSLGSHRLKHLSRPETIFELITDGTEDFPPLRSREAVPNNLPFELTTYVPRDDEAFRLTELIVTSRMVTVAGAGGSGKTRLTLRVAAEMLDQFQHGVWVADFAPVVDVGLVSQTIASHLGIMPQASGDRSGLEEESTGSQSVEERLLAFLRDKDMLLVLDNCEHLIAPSADIVTTLLRSCEHLKIVTTTREPLGVAGEVVYRIPPMAVPTETDIDVEGFAAVRLFTERARQVRTDFQIDENNAASVVRICQSLEGIPLGIELAAAKVKVLSAADIADRLHDHFRLLTGGSRTALERQQTLRAVVDWSHDLLTSQEQTLLRRLAIFIGGFTLDAAEAIVGDDALPEDQVIEVLANLVDKSLLQLDETKQGSRYRMLETVRQYAREKLKDSGEGPDFRRRHRDFFLALAESGDAPFHFRDEPEALDALDAELQNLRAAIEWSLSESHAEQSLRLAFALYPWFMTRGLGVEARTWLQESLAIEGDVSTETMANAKVALARLIGPTNLERALEIAQEALALADQTGNTYSRVFARTTIGAASSFLAVNRRPLRAEVDGWYLEALKIAEDQGEQHLMVMVMVMRRYALLRQGDQDAARDMSVKSLNLSRHLGFKRGIALCLWGTASDLAGKGELDDAERHAEEAEAIFLQLGDKTPPSAPTFFGRICFARGDYQGAERLCNEALRLAGESGSGAPEIAHLLLAQTLLEQGKFEEAREQERLHRAGVDRADLEIGFLFSERVLGEVAAAQGKISESNDHFEKSLEISKESPVERISALLGLSLNKIRQGALDEASRMLVDGLRAAFDSDLRSWFPSYFEAIALVKVNSGEEALACRLLGAAQAFRERTGLVVRPSRRFVVDELLDALRASLEPDAIEAGLAEGRAESMEEIIRKLLG